MYISDVSCDFCGSWIKGPVYFRQNFMICHTCNVTLGNYPKDYVAILVWLVASIILFMVLYIQS